MIYLVIIASLALAFYVSSWIADERKRAASRPKIPRARLLGATLGERIAARLGLREATHSRCGSCQTNHSPWDVCFVSVLRAMVAAEQSRRGTTHVRACGHLDRAPRYCDECRAELGGQK